jgi:hypothetical protein
MLCNKDEVKSSLFLCNEILCHDDMWGKRGVAALFLTLADDGGEWSTTRRSRLTFRDRVPCTHWMRARVSARVGLNAKEERKEQNHYFSVVETVIRRCGNRTTVQEVYCLISWRLTLYVDSLPSSGFINAHSHICNWVSSHVTWTPFLTFIHWL